MGLLSIISRLMRRAKAGDADRAEFLRGERHDRIRRRANARLATLSTSNQQAMAIHRFRRTVRAETGRAPTYAEAGRAIRAWATAD